jgi:hypothetical protein
MGWEKVRELKFHSEQHVIMLKGRMRSFSSTVNLKIMRPFLECVCIFMIR